MFCESVHKDPSAVQLEAGQGWNTRVELQEDSMMREALRLRTWRGLKSMARRRSAVLFLICAAMEAGCLSLSMAQQTAATPLGPLSARTGLLLTDEATIKFIHNSSGDIAHQYDAQLSQWSRIQASPAYDQAAEWVAGKARDVGLQQVAIEHFRSDGVTQYFGSPTMRYWDPTKAELWMKSPNEVKGNPAQVLELTIADELRLAAGTRQKNTPESGALAL